MPRERDLHEISHSKESSFLCDICGESFKSLTSMRIHRKKVHSDQPGDRFCTVCGGKPCRCGGGYRIRKSRMKGANNTYNVPLDEGYVQDKKWFCKLCPNEKFYWSAACLWRHIQWKHKNTCPCRHCYSTFENKLLRHQHVKTDHDDMRAFECFTCGKRFFKRTHMKMHQLRHTKARPFPCHICGKEFPIKSTLDSHVLRHNGKKFYTCPQPCGNVREIPFTLGALPRNHKVQKCELCGERMTLIKSRPIIRELLKRSNEQQTALCDFDTNYMY